MIQPDKAESDKLVLVGVITKPHSYVGDVKVKPLTDFPSRFSVLKRVFVISKNGEICSFTVEKNSVMGDSIVVKFAEISSRSEAESIVGYEIAIPQEECVDLPSDSFFAFDLIGMKIVLSNGKPVGTVVDVYSNSAQDILKIETTAKKEVLVPFVKTLVPEISMERREMVVEDLPGLFPEEYDEN